MQSNTTCPVCKGTGFTLQINLMKAKTDRMPCAKCNGTGEVKVEQTEGIRFGRRMGETWFAQELKDAHPIATLEFRVCPVTINGVPQYKINGSALFKKQQRKARYYIEIVRMNTKEAFRRQGIMERLVLNTCGDPKIEWAETNIEDSTPEGITLLKKCGFIEEGQKLIREMYAEKT